MWIPCGWGLASAAGALSLPEDAITAGRPESSGGAGMVNGNALPAPGAGVWATAPEGEGSGSVGELSRTTGLASVGLASTGLASLGAGWAGAGSAGLVSPAGFAASPEVNAWTASAIGLLTGLD